MTWADRLTIIGATIVIVGFIWVLHRDHKEDIKKSEEWYREDKKESDQKWTVLFEKFHIHDKDIEKFRIHRKDSNKN